MKWRIRLPEDPAKRTLALAIVTSVLFHLFVMLPVFVFPSLLQPAPYVKRGEPLLVDIAPERPEEKAPLGNPSEHVAPPQPPPQPPPRPAAPPRPPAPARTVEAPRVPAPRPAPPAPTPPPVARAEPAPEPIARAPEPERPAAPETAPTTPGEVTAPPSAAPPQVAVARPPDAMRRQPGGGGLLGGGRGGVEGAPIPLDTPEPKYQDYFNKIRERIKANWIYPRQAGERGIEGELLIEFHIAKDGRVAFIELRHSSGTTILDDAALTAIKLAQPFPPVPDAIAKQTLAINGQFKYQIVSGLVNQFLR